jgi:hypothetical protein
MKTRSIVLTIALCVVGLSMSFAQSPEMGTWKLNEAKSKIPAGFMKNTTVIYAAEGDKVKVTTDGTDGKGNPLHTEWVGNIDGKDYPLTGDPGADSRCYTRVSARELTLTNKKDGKATTTGKIVVSADGKTRTLSAHGTDADGKKVSTTAVYDKQ